METTSTERAPFTRRFMLGRHADGDLWVDVEWKDERLSISGVIGPKSNGDAKGSAGQILTSLRDEIATAEGWDRPTIDRLADAWGAWHLNDMRAGCEHQRAEGWDKRPIDPTKPTDTYGTHYEGQRSPSWNMLAWVRPDEHPGGLLTAPCPTCGYRYGSAWLTEEVPTDVLDFLRSLPEATKHYPWEH